MSGTFAGIVAIFAVPLTMYLKERQENRFNKQLIDVKKSLDSKEDIIKLKDEQIKEIKKQVEDWEKRTMLLEEKIKFIEEERKTEVEKTRKELEETKRKYEERLREVAPHVVAKGFKIEKSIIRAAAFLSPAKYAYEKYLTISNEGKGKALYVKVTCTLLNPETGWEMMLKWNIAEILPKVEQDLLCGELNEFSSYPYKILRVGISFEDIYGKRMSWGPRDWVRCP